MQELTRQTGDIVKHSATTGKFFDFFQNFRRMMMHSTRVATHVSARGESQEYLDAVRQLLEEVDDAIALALDASERIAAQNVCAWEARCHTHSALKLVRAILDDLEEQRHGWGKAA